MTPEQTTSAIRKKGFDEGYALGMSHGRRFMQRHSTGPVMPKVGRAYTPRPSKLPEGLTRCDWAGVVKAAREAARRHE